MAQKKNLLPPYIRRSLAILIIFLMGISIARLLVTMHQQEERIEIMEAKIAQLLADTTRLRIEPQAYRTYRSEGGQDYRHESREGRRDHQHRQAPEHRNQQGKGDEDQDRQNIAATNDVTQNDTGKGQGVANASGGDLQTATHKFTTPHLFDLNTVDSLTLIRIPGIASRTASVILKNRQRYGGFYSPEQLREFLTWDAALDYIDEWCSKWFTADRNRLRTLALNTASISELQRHPYVTHDQAVEITRYRTRHKRISSAVELQQLNTFTPEQLQALLPYLSFE